MAIPLHLLAAWAALFIQDAPQSPPQTPTTDVEDITVTVEARTDMARAFVGRVAAPARGRGLGRWRSVCPGVANLDPAVARPIADQIATRAAELGLEVGEPGCQADIVVIFAADAQAVTQALLEAHPRVFRHGGGGIDRGSAALREFETTDRPIRWWSLSVPIDSETGRRAVRVPGDRSGRMVDTELARDIGCNPADCVIGAAPIISSTIASRLNSQIEDQLYKSIVIVDADEVSGLNTSQLGDYIALVSLAQIDPEAETGAFDTVLNLFADPTGVAGLTDWDRSYLEALYHSPSRRRSPGAQAGAVAAIMNANAGEP